MQSAVIKLYNAKLCSEFQELKWNRLCSTTSSSNLDWKLIRNISWFELIDIFPQLLFALLQHRICSLRFYHITVNGKHIFCFNGCLYRIKKMEKCFSCELYQWSNYYYKLPLKCKHIYDAYFINCGHLLRNVVSQIELKQYIF